MAENERCEVCEFPLAGGLWNFFNQSVSPTALEQYIANQAEHHRKVTFQEEYRRLLNRYDMVFDERHVWD